VVFGGSLSHHFVQRLDIAGTLLFTDSSLMHLIIVESPTKAKTLNKFLGKEYDVIATKGHIKDLPKSKLGVDLENNFEPVFEVVPKQESNVKSIVAAAKKASDIYLATDPDREGEAISAHVAEILADSKLKVDKKHIRRIVFHEITKSAVEEAIAHPRDVDAHLVDAQTARRVLDRLVGYKLSPLLWKKVRIGLSAGRVQSVTVRLIVEKEREIEAFKPVEYWEIGADVTTPEKKALTIWLAKINDKKAEVSNEKTAKEVISHLEKSTYTISEVKKREVKKRPYAPFTTSTLTQAGARMFGWSAKRTMSIAQKLYEEGVITYHRTDSVNIAEQAVSAAREFIESKYGKEYVPQSPLVYKKQSKMAQEAHEAIRPTDMTMGNVTNRTSPIDPTEYKLYDLIWRRFIACQMTDVVFDETSISVTATNGGGEYLLRASGQIMKFDGWRKLFPQKVSEEGVVLLPDVHEREVLDLQKVLSEQKFTQPPARFNEASIIKTLEKLGIGRPSTYAPTISTIQARGYVEKDEGKFKPTSVGIAVNDFLVTNFADVFEYSFTASMEDNLDKVAGGTLDWHKEIKTFWTPVGKKLTDVEKNAERVKIAVEKLGRECPECKEGELVVRQGRFGKFISCSRFPDCKYTEKIVNKIDMKCPKCEKGDIVMKKTKKGRKFFGCSTYPECDYANWKDPRKETEEKADPVEKDQAEEVSA